MPGSSALRAARRRALCAGCQLPERERRGHAATGRSSTSSGRSHLRSSSLNGGMARRRPTASTSSAEISGNLVKVWSIASQSLLSTCAGHTGAARQWVAAMPDGQRILSGGTDGGSSTWEHLRAAHQRRGRPRGAARQPARALLGRRHRQALQRTTAPSCAPSSTTTYAVYCLALLPDGSASSASWSSLRRAASSDGLAACIRPGVTAWRILESPQSDRRRRSGGSSARFRLGEGLVCGISHRERQNCSD